MTHLCYFQLKFVCLQNLLGDWIFLLSSRHWNQRRHLTEPTHRHGSGIINIDTLNFLHYTIHSSKIPISCDVPAEIWVQIHALSRSFKRLKTATCSRRHDRMSVNMRVPGQNVPASKRPLVKTYLARSKRTRVHVETYPPQHSIPYCVFVHCQVELNFIIRLCKIMQLYCFTCSLV